MKNAKLFCFFSIFAVLGAVFFYGHSEITKMELFTALADLRDKKLISADVFLMCINAVKWEIIFLLCLAVSNYFPFHHLLFSVRGFLYGLGGASVLSFIHGEALLPFWVFLFRNSLFLAIEFLYTQFSFKRFSTATEPYRLASLTWITASFCGLFLLIQFLYLIILLKL